MFGGRAFLLHDLLLDEFNGFEFVPLDELLDPCVESHEDIQRIVPRLPVHEEARVNGIHG